MGTSIVVTSANGRASHLASTRHGANKTYCNREQGRILGNVGDPITYDNGSVHPLDVTCRSCQRALTYDDIRALAV